AQAQEKAIEVARINKLLAEDDTKPQLDFVGRVDYLGRDDDGEEAYRGAYRADGYNWTAGLEVRFPWGFREARARTRQAQRDLDQEIVLLYDIKQQKALAARNAWREVQSGMKRIGVTAQSLSANEEAFEQERARFGSGLTAYRRVLEAQRDLDQARRNHLVAIIDSTRALVRMSRIDGTILARNGYTWEQLDRLAQPPVLGDHSLADEIQNY
ncbi:MAG: TolC family protein, partial [Coraliomargarita sp.]